MLVITRLSTRKGALKDAKTGARATKIRILQMLFVWTTGNRGLRPSGYTPGYEPQANALGIASFRSPTLPLTPAGKAF